MSSRSARDPQWGVLRGCAVNECFQVGAFEVKFDVSAIRGARPHMEDRWAVARHPDEDEPYVLFAVFDGHGGDAVSSFLAARFSETLFDTALRHLLRNDPGEALRRACRACDEEIVARFPKPAGFRGGPGPGSTAVVALFCLTEENPRAHVACVGDSRCVAADEHGAVVFETVDQRPSRVEERARLEALGGTVRVVGGVARAAGVLAVSRAFGNAGIKACVKAEPEVSALSLEPLSSEAFEVGETRGLVEREREPAPPAVHTVILCSDGLTDVVASARAAEATCARSPGLARRERGASGMSSSGYTPTREGTPAGTHAPPSGRRRSSSAPSVGTLGTPGGSAGIPGVPGTHGDGDGWWGSRRVAAALTSLAKMRQSADNVCVLVCRARRRETSVFPPALEAPEEGQETRKTTPVKTPVKAKTPLKIPVVRPAKTPAKTPSRFPFAAEANAASKTPVKTPSKAKTPVKAPSKGKSPSKSHARTPQSTPGSARDAKRARGGEVMRDHAAVAPSAS